jgi:hypothetical protein
MGRTHFTSTVVSRKETRTTQLISLETRRTRLVAASLMEVRDQVLRVTVCAEA